MNDSNGGTRTMAYPRVWLVGLALVCAVLAFGLMHVTAVAQGPEGNEACLSCHSNQNLTKVLPSREVLPLYVDGEVLHGSIHGTLNVQCTQCHELEKEIPHPPVNYADLRDAAIQNAATCVGCHLGQAKQQLDSIHQKEMASGNRNAPVCTDCHTAHAVTDPSTPRVRIAETCSQCHSLIADEYLTSVHGKALQENNPDVPSCVDCHNVHNIGDPTTLEFRLDSPRLCADCHTDTAVMSKYDLSTHVLDTYVADFHGTTVELFAKSSPDQPTNKPVCFDCHGVHNIKGKQDPTSAVTTHENLSKTCQSCHPDATATSFTDAWMSHYEPSPTTYPLVWGVNLFYQIIIPVTVGGLGLFIATDVFRRVRERRAHAGKTREVEQP